MQHEAPAALDRAAAQHFAVAHRRGQPDQLVLAGDAELFEDIGKAHVLDGPVHHQPHGALFAVADDVDYGFVEALVAHCGHRHQKLPPEGFHHCLHSSQSSAQQNGGNMPVTKR